MTWVFSRDVKFEYDYGTTLLLSYLIWTIVVIERWNFEYVWGKWHEFSSTWMPQLWEFSYMVWFNILIITIVPIFLSYLFYFVDPFDLLYYRSLEFFFFVFVMCRGIIMHMCVLRTMILVCVVYYPNIIYENKNIQK